MALGAPAFIYLWPRLTVGGYKRTIVRRGLGAGPIPVNTLYAVPSTSSASASRGSLLATGTDDVLYVGGWLDLRNGPQVLHVPDMNGRYYSVQFVLVIGRVFVESENDLPTVYALVQQVQLVSLDQ